jgi:hypothetical protein
LKIKDLNVLLCQSLGNRIQNGPYNLICSDPSLTIYCRKGTVPHVKDGLPDGLVIAVGTTYILSTISWYVPEKSILDRVYKKS